MQIAILIPCFNEEAAIGGVIESFQQACPQAQIFVFDNASTDATMRVASEMGVTVRQVVDRGKGNVVRRMFADVEADIYLLVDGDGTYNAASAPALISAMTADGLDMVVGRRMSSDASAYRPGHKFGNRMLTNVVRKIFGHSFRDMLSGYRVMSRRFVKSFPALSVGFEIETELTVHALELRMPVAEVDTPYGARVDGSHSKLRTYRDGTRILLTILKLVKAERPLAFFSTAFVACLALALIIAAPLFQTYLETGLVPRFPTAILCAAIVLFGTILLACGIILETVTLGRQEIKRATYLMHQGPRRSTSALNDR